MDTRTKWHHHWWFFTGNYLQWEWDLKASINVQRICLKDHSFGHTFFFITSLMSNILHYLVIKSSNPLRALDHYRNSCSPPHWHLNRIRGCICPFPLSSLAGPNSFAKTLGCWAPWTLNERLGSSRHGTPRFSKRSSFFPAFTPYWAAEWTE